MDRITNTKASEDQTSQLFLQPPGQTHLQLLYHKVPDLEKPVNYRKGIRKVKLNFIFFFYETWTSAGLIHKFLQENIASIQ